MSSPDVVTEKKRNAFVTYSTIKLAKIVEVNPEEMPFWRLTQIVEGFNIMQRSCYEKTLAITPF